MLRPRLCSAPLREELRAALRPGHEISRLYPEHLALGFLGVEPEQGQVGKLGLEQFAAAADFAQQAAAGVQLLAGFLQNSPDDAEPVRPAIERDLRLGAA